MRKPTREKVGGWGYASVRSPLPMLFISGLLVRLIERKALVNFVGGPARLLHKTRYGIQMNAHLCRSQKNAERGE